MLQVLLLSTALLAQEPQAARTVPMPRLVGRPFDEARAILERSRLRLGRVDSLDTLDPLHTVLRQSVESRFLVPVGTPIDLVISFRASTAEDVGRQAPIRSVPESVSVPDLTDSTLAAAAVALGRRRLATGEIEWVERAGPLGVVVSQRPQPGERVALGTPVTLRVSTQVRSVRVPSVVDSTLTRAQAVLRGAGFRVGRIDSLVDPRPAGTVVRQLPAGGDSVSPSVAVDLWIVRRSPVPDDDPQDSVIPPTVSSDTGGVLEPDPETADSSTTVVPPEPPIWLVPAVVGGAAGLLALLAKLGVFVRGTRQPRLPKDRSPKPPTTPGPPPAAPALELRPHRDLGRATVNRGEPVEGEGIRLRAIVDHGTPTIGPDERLAEEDLP